MEHSSIKILFVDDEKDILEFMSFSLKKDGFKVLTADNGIHAIEIAKKEQPDLIVLDIMMPGIDGIELCKELRDIHSLKDTIIVFLTARGEDYSQVAGFEAGADDYITKPIRPRVFVSRIKALLRRRSLNMLSENIVVNGIQIDRERYVVTCNGERVYFRKKEFELLALLAEKPGKVFTRNEILKTVWGNEIIVGDRTVDVHVNKIREKIGDKYIQTIKGVGYKFEL